MDSEKNITAKDLIDYYMNDVLENEIAPKNVYAFAKQHSFDEALFYQFFGSFQALEQAIFTTFFEHTLALLSDNEDYANYDARHKLLSFYYTFFELLTANRSFVVWALKKQPSPLKGLQKLQSLRTKFIEYINTLEIEKMDFEQSQLSKIQDKTLSEAAWGQLLVTLNFWLDDTSAGFEKTDIFIEKSINTSFDVMDTQPLKSVWDLGKFWVKEKFKTT